MAEALRPAVLEGLVDRRKAECLTGMDRGVEVRLVDLVERFEVSRGRKAVFGAGDVEPDHAVVAVPNGQLCDIARFCRLAHRREKGADHDGVPGRGGRFGSQRKALLNRPHDLIEGQTGFQVLFGGKAHLGVHNAVFGQVLGTLRCHPDKGVTLLHHPDRVIERFEIERKRQAIGASADPRRELFDIGCGEAFVAKLRGQFDHRCRTQPAIEVVVKKGFRGPFDVVASQRCHIRPLCL